MDVSVAPRPDPSRRPREVIARYSRRHADRGGLAGLDYFMATYLRLDDTGNVNEAALVAEGAATTLLA